MSRAGLFKTGSDQTQEFLNALYPANASEPDFKAALAFLQTNPTANIDFYSTAKKTSAILCVPILSPTNSHLALFEAILNHHSMTTRKEHPFDKMVRAIVLTQQYYSQDNTDNRFLQVLGDFIRKNSVIDTKADLSEMVFQSHQNNAQPENVFNNHFSDFPRNELWRLFCDGTLQLKDGDFFGWFGFVNREKNYLSSMANGFSLMRSTLGQEFNVQLLIDLHATCTDKVLQKGKKADKITQGLRDKSDNHFSLSENNATILGVLELVEYARTVKHAGYSLIDTGDFRLTGLPLLQDEISRNLQLIIDDYKINCQSANTPDEKLLAIAKLITLLERHHPFHDGNCRTICMLVLQRELIRNGFPPVILDDPNYFDGCSVSECVGHIKQGIKNFIDVKNGNATRFGKTTDTLIAFSTSRGPLFEKVIFSPFNDMIDVFRTNEIGCDRTPARPQPR